MCLFPLPNQLDWPNLNSLDGGIGYKKDLENVKQLLGQDSQ